MESEKVVSRKSSTQKPLNVSRAKIEETRARLQGDVSNEALKEPLVSSEKIHSVDEIYGQVEDNDVIIDATGGLEDSGENDGQKGLESSSFEELQEELGESNLVSSSLSTESDTTLLGFSENVEWVRRNFKRPLALAMRDILATKPSDPIHFLALWLLNYRSAQEKQEFRQQQDRELMEERSRIQKLLSRSSSEIEEPVDIQKINSNAEIYGENEGIGDSNFQNYTN